MCATKHEASFHFSDSKAPDEAGSLFPRLPPDNISLREAAQPRIVELINTDRLEEKFALVILSMEVVQRDKGE